MRLSPHGCIVYRITSLLDILAEAFSRDFLREVVVLGAILSSIGFWSSGKVLNFSRYFGVEEEKRVIVYWDSIEQVSNIASISV